MKWSLVSGAVATTAPTLVSGVKTPSSTCKSPPRERNALASQQCGNAAGEVALFVGGVRCLMDRGHSTPAQASRLQQQGTEQWRVNDARYVWHGVPVYRKTNVEAALRASCNRDQVAVLRDSACLVDAVVNEPLYADKTHSIPLPRHMAIRSTAEGCFPCVLHDQE